MDFSLILIELSFNTLDLSPHVTIASSYLLLTTVALFPCQGPDSDEVSGHHHVLSWKKKIGFM